MGAALYILGTSHPLQCGTAACAQVTIDAFHKELRKICDVRKIRRIAEEMTTEGLKQQGVTETIAEKVAKSMGIAHHNVDLTTKERSEIALDDSSVINAVRSLGISDRVGAFREAFDELVDDVRERCWSGRILARNEWPTLFVCGANHVKSVRRLWCCLGIDAVIVHVDYEP
jgi:hypothetical protein